jgi:hypothetical protein
VFLIGTFISTDGQKEPGWQKAKKIFIMTK